MKNSEKNLADKIFSDSGFESEAAQEIEKMIDDEMAKPEKNRDYSKVKELTAAYCEITGANKHLDEFTADKMLSNIKERSAKSKPKHTKKYRALMSLAAAAVVMIGINCFSVFAFDMNIISAIIRLTEGGFTVNFKDESSQISLPTSENDPFGFIAECAKYDVYLEETPHYLPEGFVLTNIEPNVNENYTNTVSFIFKKGNQSIAIDYIRYWNDVGQICIPSDHYNISETEVNGYPAIISKEDNQYTITYQKDKTVFFLFCKDVSYDECDKIVQSIK